MSTAFDRSCVDNPVTAIAIGNHFSGLLMAVGHKSGLLNLWEMRSSSSNAMPTFTWHLSKSIQGTHASAITALVLIEMSATNFALAADAHGRLVCHNLNRHLSVAAQALAGLARKFGFQFPRNSPEDYLLVCIGVALFVAFTLFFKYESLTCFLPFYRPIFICWYG